MKTCVFLRSTTALVAGAISVAPALAGANASAHFGPAFASWYAQNYMSIRNEVGFTKDACAAFVSTALRRYGVSTPRELWAPNMPSQLAALGWTRIDNAWLLRRGDVVFTRDHQTSADGLTPHVFVFHGYAEPGWFYAIDNQGNGYKRNITASGPQAWFWFAYRHPDTPARPLPQPSPQPPLPPTPAPSPTPGECKEWVYRDCRKTFDAAVCLRLYPGCASLPESSAKAPDEAFAEAHDKGLGGADARAEAP